jgi:hypothetical protein
MGTRDLVSWLEKGLGSVPGPFLFILRGMGAVAEIGMGMWGLARAREIARRIEGAPVEVKRLVKVLFAEDVELRKRAADVARRITDVDPEPLEAHADELAGLLGELTVGEHRLRWHLGLVVPRVARTREQRMRAARLMMLLEGDKSNVVRCSAVEGMGRWRSRILPCVQRQRLWLSDICVGRRWRCGAGLGMCGGCW